MNSKRTAIDTFDAEGLPNVAVGDAMSPYIQRVADVTEASDPLLNRTLGFGVLLTGLSGAGKSTLAQSLAQRWELHHGRLVTVLDGDEARRMLSSELGFSREHRNINVTRMGYVASEVVRHGGASIIAAIAPYESGRAAALDLIRGHGKAFLVHVSTTLATCEKRDPKGLYAMARSGALNGLTGINDPYEEPSMPDLTLDLGNMDVVDACRAIEAMLARHGLGCLGS